MAVYLNKLTFYQLMLLQFKIGNYLNYDDNFLWPERKRGKQIVNEHSFNIINKYVSEFWVISIVQMLCPLGLLKLFLHNFRFPLKVN